MRRASERGRKSEGFPFIFPSGSQQGNSTKHISVNFTKTQFGRLFADALDRLSGLGYPVDPVSLWRRKMAIFGWDLGDIHSSPTGGGLCSTPSTPRGTPSTLCSTPVPRVVPLAPCVVPQYPVWYP